LNCPRRLPVDAGAAHPSGPVVRSVPVSLRLRFLAKFPHNWATVCLGSTPDAPRTPPAASLSRRLLRRVPMPLLAVLIGLLVGFVVWRCWTACSRGPPRHVPGPVAQRARPARPRVPDPVRAFHRRGRLDGAAARRQPLPRRLPRPRPLVQARGELAGVREGPQPPWLTVIAEWKDRERVRQILLFDAAGQLREIYPLGPEPLPSALKKTPVASPKAATSPLAFATIEGRPTSWCPSGSRTTRWKRSAR